MSKEIRAGGAFIEIYLKERERLDAKFKSYKARLDAFARGVAMVGGALSAVSGAALGGLGAAFASFTGQGDKLTDTANRLGITTQRLQELTYAAGQSGATMEDVERAMLQAQKKGLDFERVAATIAKIEDPVKRTQAAFAAFGKSGPRIAPMLAELSQLSARANQLGLVFKPEDVSMAGKLADMWHAIGEQVASVAFHVGSALAPAMESVFGITQQVLAVTIKFVDQNRALVVGAAIGAIALGALGGAFLAVAAGAYIASAAMTAYNVVAAIALALTTTIAGPLVLIGLAVLSLGAALVAAAAYWAIYTESGQAAMKFLWETVSTTFKGISDALMSGNFKLAWDIAFAGIYVVFTKFQEKLIAGWESMKTRLLNSTVDMAKQINNLLPSFLQVPGLEPVGNALKSQRADAEKGANAQSAAMSKAAQTVLDALAAKAAAEKAAAFPEFKKPTLGGVGGPSFEPGGGTAGAFNAAVKGLLGQMGVSDQKKIKEATEKTAEGVDEVVKLISAGGVVWA